MNEKIRSRVDKGPARSRRERSGRRQTSAKPASPQDALKIWNMRLYVAGQSTRSVAAIANLRRICDEHLLGRYSIEVVDLVSNPELARADQIVALPTLIRKMPVPVRRIIGDLSATERVLVSLDLNVM